MYVVLKNKFNKSYKQKEHFAVLEVTSSYWNSSQTEAHHFSKLKEKF